MVWLKLLCKDVPILNNICRVSTQTSTRISNALILVSMGKYILKYGRPGFELGLLN